MYCKKARKVEKKVEDFFKFFGLFRIYELYAVKSSFSILLVGSDNQFQDYHMNLVLKNQIIRACIRILDLRLQSVL